MSGHERATRDRHRRGERHRQGRRRCACCAEGVVVLAVDIDAARPRRARRGRLRDDDRRPRRSRRPRRRSPSAADGADYLVNCRRHHQGQADLRGDASRTGARSRRSTPSRSSSSASRSARGSGRAARSSTSRRVRPSSPRRSRSRPMPRRRRRSCRSPAPSPMRWPRGRCGSTPSAPASSIRRCRTMCSTGVATMRGTDAADARARRATRPCRSAAPRAPTNAPALIWFLLSDEAAYMTGQAMNFTGGLVTW